MEWITISQYNKHFQHLHQILGGSKVLEKKDGELDDLERLHKASVCWSDLQEM